MSVRTSAMASSAAELTVSEREGSSGGRICKPDATARVLGRAAAPGPAKRKLIRVHALVQMQQHEQSAAVTGCHGDVDNNVGVAAEQLRAGRFSLEERLSHCAAVTRTTPESHTAAQCVSNAGSGPFSARRSVRQQDLELQAAVVRLGQLRAESVHRSESAERFIASTPAAGNAELKEKARADAEVLFLLDFDDTLFPTAHIVRCGLVRASTSGQPQAWTIVPSSRISPKLRDELREAQIRAVEFLMALDKLGTVVVVTNAALSWVRSALDSFAPILGEYIRSEGIRVISARIHTAEALESPRTKELAAGVRSPRGLARGRASNLKSRCDALAEQASAVLEALTPTSAHVGPRAYPEHLSGKASIFRHEISKTSHAAYSRVVVIGDSESDMIAARAALLAHRAVQSTLVKLPQYPSTVQLTAALRFLSEHAQLLASVRREGLELMLDYPRKACSKADASACIAVRPTDIAVKHLTSGISSDAH